MQTDMALRCLNVTDLKKKLSVPLPFNGNEPLHAPPISFACDCWDWFGFLSLPPWK